MLMSTDVTGGGYIGLWVILYFVLLVFLGVTCLRKGGPCGSSWASFCPSSG